MMARALLVWVGLLLLAVLNGGVRDTWLSPRMLTDQKLKTSPPDAPEITTVSPGRGSTALMAPRPAIGVV